MRAIKFVLKGKTAFFKVPKVNEYCYFTYGNIHKPALLGMFGAILGYGGYAAQKESDDYPQYYNQLKQLHLSVVPESKNGYFYKKIQSFNNSVGYASLEQGGNLIVNQQWIENPQWTVYILLEDEESEMLASMLKEKRCVYIPYFGTNDHPAVIEEVEEVELKRTEKQEIKIHSLGLSEDFVFDLEEMSFKYEEYLPVSLNQDTNGHELKKFILTDAPVEEAYTDIYTDGVRNLAFY